MVNWVKHCTFGTIGQSILSMESLDGSVVIAHVLVSALQLQLSESISTISMEYLIQRQRRQRILNNQLSVITRDHLFTLMSFVDSSWNGSWSIITHSMRPNPKPFTRYSNI